jgi:hypothetical protein
MANEYTLKHSSNVPASLLSAFKQAGYLIDNSPNTVTDVAITGAQQKPANKEDVRIANMGRVCNRLVSLTSRFRDIRVLAEELSAREKPVVSPDKSVNTFNVDFAVVVQPNRLDSYFACYAEMGYDLLRKIKGSLQTLTLYASGWLNENQAFVCGNVFNPKGSIGAWEIYRCHFTSEGLLTHASPLVAAEWNVTSLEFARTLTSTLLRGCPMQVLAHQPWEIASLGMPRQIIDPKRLFVAAEKTYARYVLHEVERFMKEANFKEIDFSEISHLPNSENIIGLTMRTNQIDDKEQAAIITKMPLVSNMKGAFDILNDKNEFYHFAKDLLPETIGDSSGTNVNTALFPFSMTLRLSEEDAFERLEIMFAESDYDWIFKPALGTQGRGIFVQTKSQDAAEKAYQRMQLENRQESKRKGARRNFDGWIISHFINNPLLFEPFGSNLPTGIPTGGRKSHVRFYMNLVKTKERFRVHVDKIPLLFVACMPYSNCIEYFANGEFGAKTSLCNQSNLTMGMEYFKKKLNLSDPKLAYKLFSAKAEEAFDEKFQTGYYDEHIAPQIERIAWVIERLLSTSEQLCANGSNPNFLGCFQMIAVDVMFDDGSRTDGVPHAWILEANMTPGMRAPEAIYSHGFTDFVGRMMAQGLSLQEANTEEEMNKTGDEAE